MVKYCSLCRKVHPMFTEKCPICGNPDLKRFCPECGKFVPYGEMACPICGDIDPTITNTGKKTVSKKKPKLSIILGSIIVSIVFIACVVLVYGYVAQYELPNKSEYDFRFGKWGDDRATIKSADEELNPICRAETWKDDILQGYTTLNGYYASFTYHFSNDKLEKGLYMITPTFSSGEKYIELYHTFVEFLTTQYGKPSIDDIQSLADNSLLKTVPDSVALEQGYVIYYAVFETKTADIMLTTTSKDGKLTLAILYTHTDYYEGQN